MLPLSESPSSFLVIRFSSLGDILLTTPALRALSRAYPRARIDVLVKETYRELLAGNPHLSRVLTPPAPADRSALQRLTSELKGNYDAVIDLHTSLRSHYVRRRVKAAAVYVYRKRRFRRWLLVRFKKDVYGGAFSIPKAYLEALKPLGVTDDGGGLEWPAAQAARDRFLNLAGVSDVVQRSPIALCPGASFATKRWLLDYWKELAEKLLQRGDRLWIFGDSSDAEAGAGLQDLDPDKITDFCGKLSLVESGAGLSFCRLAVTHDAGPAHMAAAVGTPVVTIYGSTVTRFGFRPFRIPHRVCEIDLPCRPCSHLGFERCPRGHFRCMTDLTPDAVFAQIETLEASLDAS